MITAEYAYNLLVMSGYENVLNCNRAFVSSVRIYAGDIVISTQFGDEDNDYKNPAAGIVIGTFINPDNPEDSKAKITQQTVVVLWSNLTVDEDA